MDNQCSQQKRVVQKTMSDRLTDALTAARNSADEGPLGTITLDSDAYRLLYYTSLGARDLLRDRGE